MLIIISCNGRLPLYGVLISLFFNFHQVSYFMLLYFFLYSCATWVYIVAFIKVLIMYQIDYKLISLVQKYK
jgi:Fe2+ transport system protein B